jgi:hypothetical protein
VNIREDRANVIPAFQNTDGFIGIRCRDSFEPGLLHPAGSGVDLGRGFGRLVVKPLEDRLTASTKLARLNCVT